jgi:hypothetical protein
MKSVVSLKADEIYVTSGNKGQSRKGGHKEMNHQPRKRGKKQPPGRGHFQKDSPAIIAFSFYTVLVVHHKDRSEISRDSSR